MLLDLCLGLVFGGKMKFDDILEVLESDKKILDFKFSKSQIPMYSQILT